MKPLSSYLQDLRYYAVLAVIGFIRFLPYPLARSLFRFLGMLAYHADPFHRKIAAIQMRAALALENPEKLVKKVFMNQAEILVDTIKYAYMTDKQITEKIVVENREYLDEALSKGKGLMMITGHMGNWEILPHVPRILGIQFCIMADMREDEKIEAIVDSIRSRSGATILPPTGKALMLIKELKKGRTIGMVVDKRGAKKDALFCPLLGIPAPTNPAPAFLAIKGDAVILPVYGVKLDGIHHFRFQKPVEASSFGQGKEAIQALSEYMQSWVASVVEQYPDQWFWLYSRWINRKMFKKAIQNLDDFKAQVISQANKGGIS
jgi:Kdo2-lipid IVA lauroyltransferase/acyltransferase